MEAGLEGAGGGACGKGGWIRRMDGRRDVAGGGGAGWRRLNGMKNCTVYFPHTQALGKP